MSSQSNDITENGQRLSEYLVFLAIEKDCPENTILSYRGAVNEFLDYLETGELALPSVTPEHIAKYINGVKAKFGITETVSHRFYVLRAFFDFLLGKRYINRNPLADIHAPKTRKHQGISLTVAEVFGLLDGVKNLAESQPGAFPTIFRDYTILELAYGCGARRAEVAGLKLADVQNHRPCIRLFGKGDKERVVPLSSMAWDAIDRYLGKSRPKFAKEDSPDIIFLNRFGQPLSHRHYDRLIKQYSQMFGITRPMSMHILRHSFATHLLEAGCQLRAVQEMLGHRFVVTTQVYVHPNRKHLQNVVSRIHPRGEA